MKIIATRICHRTGVDIWRSFDSFFDEGRKAKIDRCLQKHQQQRMMAGDILLHYVLRHELCLDKSKTRVIYSPSGKPALNDWPHLFFNISHSGEWVAIVLASCEVGIDVEKQDPRFAKLAESILSPSERKTFCGVQDHADFLCRRWVMKESFVKLMGTGLGFPMTKISFDMISAVDAVTVYEKKCYFCRTYELVRFKTEEAYPLAVCSESYNFPDEVTILPYNSLLKWAIGTVESE
ncbi:4'-phosphopantetheinyl transferase family protein [Paenibacillus planticolens]|nr:4'-phosphopantetheinyl transferase superfamily protein [Paenibacillus planticolens]